MVPQHTMDSSQNQITLLSTLLQLEQSARDAETEASLAFVMVNETLRLFRFRQAVFGYEAGPGRMRLEAVSGVDRPDPRSPFGQALQRVLGRLAATREGRAPVTVSEDDLDDRDREAWREWGLGRGLWCPFVTPEGHTGGGLLFTREEPWQEGEAALLERLTHAYAHAWHALRQTKQTLSSRLKTILRQKRIRLLLAILTVGVLCLPVRLSVLCPVEIVPQEPVVVSAPMDGVVRSVHVEPNQAVRTGQHLFSLDDTATRNAHEVAKKALEVARAEYMRATQKGFSDEKSRGEVLLLKARIERETAEVAYAEERLQRGRVHAEKEGVAVFSDVYEWVGTPVVTGEKVMSLADPNRVEAEMMLPVDDAINLAAGAEIHLFLNTQPDRPIRAVLVRAAYEAHVTPLGELAFRLKGALDPDPPLPRIGLRGTAKIYGQTVSLFYYLMRRPLTEVRLWLGI